MYIEIVLITVHKFPEVGHSYLEYYREFGRIAKVIRIHQTILIPTQYRDIIKSASIMNIVCSNMEQFFYDFKKLPVKFYFIKKQIV